MDNKAIKLLEDIKKLLILQLLANGIGGDAIAQMLRIDPSTIRHMISLKKVKKSKNEQT